MQQQGEDIINPYLCFKFYFSFIRGIYGCVFTVVSQTLVVFFHFCDF